MSSVDLKMQSIANDFFKEKSLASMSLPEKQNLILQILNTEVTNELFNGKFFNPLTRKHYSIATVVINELSKEVGGIPLWIGIFDRIYLTTCFFVFLIVS